VEDAVGVAVARGVAEAVGVADAVDVAPGVTCAATAIVAPWSADAVVVAPDSTWSSWSCASTSDACAFARSTRWLALSSFASRSPLETCSPSLT
jgi:hypothetical protein